MRSKDFDGKVNKVTLGNNSFTFVLKNKYGSCFSK